MVYTLRNLLRDIKHKDTVLFIGAGATKCKTMPSKRQLPDGKEMKYILYKDRYPDEKDEGNLELRFKEEFKNELDELIEKKILNINYIPPEFVWEKCISKDKTDLPWYHRNLESMFSIGKYIPPSYKFLSWLHLDDSNKINHIITTNFDEKLEDAYKLVQTRGLFSDITVFTAAVDEDYLKLIVPSKDTKIILKLHGTLSKPYSIQSSFSDLKRLSLDKYSTIKEIISQNQFVVFIGYSCNDTDVYNALIQIGDEISEDRRQRHIKFCWIKRNPIEEDSKICNVLKNFDPKSKNSDTKPEENILQMDSYDCISKIFENNIKTDKIDFSFIKENTSRSYGKKIGDTGVSTKIDEKDPIKDILHGNIIFSADEAKDIFKIINSFDMQRLRDIKQLSFAQYKFPAATHSRFSHSLGVAYLVKRALCENRNLNEHAKNLGPEAICNTIYAALLHDVGHGALGHVLDKFYDRLGEANEHENFTKQFIDEGLYDLSNVLKDVHLQRKFIQDLITFSFDPKKSENSEKIFLSWLITDNGLDLDRIDFLMRDRLMTNCDINLDFPLLFSDHRSNDFRDKGILRKIIDNYILRLNVATKDQIHEDHRSDFPDGAKILYVDEDEKCDTKNLIPFLLSFYVQMYTKVYYDDRVAAAEAMMAKALNIAYTSGDIDRSLLYIFTDSELFSYLEKLENDIIRELVYSVKMRRLFKPIISININNISSSHTACVIEELIEKRLNLDPTDFKSVIIVNLPRKKKIKNLFVRQGFSIVPYPNLKKYNDELSKIEGKLFVNPNCELFVSKEKKQQILDILTSNKIQATIVDNKKTEYSKKNVTSSPTLDKYF